MMRPMSQWICLTLTLLCVLSASADNTLPQLATEQHLGVASCANGVCHGSVKVRTATTINQNEYVVWSLRDRHRIAYNTLLSAESRAIAAKLGLDNAHEAAVCLDCHADNVAPELRGARFQIADGVGCESCHGGAQKYIASHTHADTPRAQLLESGMYPSADIRSRARLCLSCHLGTAQKMATHEIMGAGHPRLSFELETFGVLQPAHYVVDADYEQAKWSGSSVEIWAIGQVESARQSLLLIEQRLSASGLFPELALFDCHACHHPMSDQRWQQSERSRLPPGSVRLNDASFTMLFAIAGVLQSDLEQRLRDGLQKLHQAVAGGAPFQATIASLLVLIDEVDSLLQATQLQQQAPGLIAAIIETAAQGRLHDYVAAEQALMAVNMLLSVSDQKAANAAWLDAAYTTLADEDHFDAVAFAQQLQRYR